MFWRSFCHWFLPAPVPASVSPGSHSLVSFPVAPLLSFLFIHLTPYLPMWLYYHTLKIEASGVSRMYVNFYQAVWPYIPEDRAFHLFHMYVGLCCRSLFSCILAIFTSQCHLYLVSFLCVYLHPEMPIYYF